MLNIGLINNQEENNTDLTNIVKEAHAGGESVTCHSDPGGTCVVGSEAIKDYDEGCWSWLWV